MRTDFYKPPALLAVLAFACGCWLTPPSAHAATGGAAPNAGTQTSSPAASAPAASTPATSTSTSTPAAPGATGSTSATATPEPAIVVSAGPVSFRTQSIALLGHTLNFTGSARPRYAGSTIEIELFDATRNTWVRATSTRADSHGAFLAHWRTSLLGRVSVRALVLRRGASSRGAHAAGATASTPTQVTVYQAALATYYGPGFYDHQTACGQTLIPALIGVANRTLPCGTLVEVSYGGRRLTVPVVDRGPYANGADWDLTAGAAQALAITGTEKIGTLVVGSVPNTPTLGLPPAPPPAIAATGGAPAG